MRRGARCVLLRSPPAEKPVRTWEWSCVCAGFSVTSRSGFSRRRQGKVKSSAKIAGRFSGKGGHGSHYSPPATRQQDIKKDWCWEILWGCLVINSMEWAWYQFTLAKTIRQNNKQKKDGWGSETPSHTMRGVPNVGHSSCAQRVHSVLVVRRTIDAMLADVVRVGVLTPLNHL